MRVDQRLSPLADKLKVTSYRVSPQFIFVFIAAAIVLAFFIHRYRLAVNGGQTDLSSKSAVEKYEQIEELPRDWIETEPLQSQ